jgi:teichuronic acid biosynthesis glycosyltransferase TuaG
LKAEPLVSIITPAFNAAKYIKEAIDSVLTQSYSNWELLIVNDGSTDSTGDIAKSYNDNRILYFEQEKKGVSAARNTALGNMSGHYFCFLDADDILPKDSLKDRLKVFMEDENIEFVDGYVSAFADKTNEDKRQYKPNYKGNPFSKLLAISEDVFFGSSWMIKVNKGKYYRFNTHLSHAEELLFYLSISNSGNYSYTSTEIYKYRLRHDSSMSNLTGLENGYRKLLQIVSSWDWVSEGQKNTLRRKIRSILFKSYISEGRLLKATKMLSI